MVTGLPLLLNEDLCRMQWGTTYFHSNRNYVCSVTLADLLSKAVDLHSLAFIDLQYIFNLLQNVATSYLTVLHNIVF